ncbi:hypothetical protein [Glycomyces sp. NPDC048151]|uniref:hypothetical protein n=1 Tax=Glycomyces sp. NPDC048151 TaxID=3364002 RepID=UPI00371E2A5B
MNDQYRITEPPPQQGGVGHFTIMTVALWIGVVAGFVLNTGLQAVGLHFAAIPFGAIALGCGIALIVRAVKTRNRR